MQLNKGDLSTRAHCAVVINKLEDVSGTDSAQKTSAVIKDTQYPIENAEPSHEVLTKEGDNLTQRKETEAKDTANSDNPENSTKSEAPKALLSKEKPPICW